MKYLLLTTGKMLSTASLAHTSTFTISSKVGFSMKSALCFSITISTAAGIPVTDKSRKRRKLAPIIHESAKTANMPFVSFVNTNDKF